MLRLAEGDAAALETLYDRYVRQCFGLALRLLGESRLAEEVVQEVFLKLWSRPDSYSPERGRFAGWLLSLVHHRSVDELRKHSHTELPIDNPEAGSVLDMRADPAPGPAEEVLSQERREMVRWALREIDEAQRQVLQLAYFQGLSQSQIAERLGQPLGTVKTRMRTGTLRLRELLAAQGLLGD